MRRTLNESSGGCYAVIALLTDQISVRKEKDWMLGVSQLDAAAPRLQANSDAKFFDDQRLGGSGDRFSWVTVARQGQVNAYPGCLPFGWASVYLLVEALITSGRLPVLPPSTVVLRTRPDVDLTGAMITGVDDLRSYFSQGKYGGALGLTTEFGTGQSDWLLVTSWGAYATHIGMPLVEAADTRNVQRSRVLWDIGVGNGWGYGRSLTSHGTYPWMTNTNACVAMAAGGSDTRACYMVMWVSMAWGHARIWRGAELPPAQAVKPAPVALTRGRAACQKVHGRTLHLQSAFTLRSGAEAEAYISDDVFELPSYQWPAFCHVEASELLVDDSLMPHLFRFSLPGAVDELKAKVHPDLFRILKHSYAPPVNCAHAPQPPAPYHTAHFASEMSCYKHNGRDAFAHVQWGRLQDTPPSGPIRCQKERAKVADNGKQCSQAGGINPISPDCFLNCTTHVRSPPMGALSSHSSE